MTASTERPPSGDEQTGEGTGGPLGADWRARAQREQRAAVPAGRVAVSCSAPLGKGGLGRHLGEILAALERGGARASCICGSTRASAPAPSGGGAPGDWRDAGVARLTGWLARLPGASPGLRTRGFLAEFDAFAARRLPAAEHLIAFNSQALLQLRAARGAGYESLILVSANSHLRRVARQHERARARYPLEGSWTAHLVGRNLAEYELAERIHVASGYIRESFLAEGVAEEKLVDFPLTPDPRYTPGERAGGPPGTGTFDVVYVGSLAVHKGVPLLIDAFRRVEHADMRLVLVGGWSTRGMRRFVQRACAADSRIVAGAGDPLPALRRARLCVHAAYEDGFGYAPAEALACGVPLLVSEDTGMRELIGGPSQGLVLPTGDLEALSESLDAAYRGEILGG
ncbi:MAG TPA: glycosyltransferase family 4 protein [Solirubrobacteraceae bacterium]|nr:glycosyltransferase family 4 protein [Solirubrobacteraceae bacterium]